VGGEELWRTKDQGILAEKGVTWRAASVPQRGGRVCSDSY